VVLEGGAQHADRALDRRDRLDSANTTSSGVRRPTLTSVATSSL
jgi:hypothetical protein